jgi:RNA polymerase sigma-70 factor (ECF subfamily)
VKKRIQRSKKLLADLDLELELPPQDEMSARLASVHDVLYLMFNEGYSTSQGHEPLRDDICEEAARLCHLLCEHQIFSSPESRALLALMLAHAARLAARLDADGAAVLLADQDRGRWDRDLIRHADHWLHRSKTDHPSRFHLEAAIALTHCHAKDVSETDWSLIVRFYDRLLDLQPSPLYTLNRAIARGESGDLATALAELESIRQHPDMRHYFLLDCAVGRLHELGSDNQAAIASYRSALSNGLAPHERVLIEKKMARLQ